MPRKGKSDNEARHPGDGGTWGPALKKGPVMSTKMRDQVLAGWQGRKEQAPPQGPC